ncbi:gamma-glutamylcyclotransferase family protein [Streptomyces sp. NPDC047061]|uniref:gamma-glutamylcyclotransferase family protein n=1 Tax=Streptomyces sp. NPDC047061 TaxID=3154605 RepID=UPI0033D22B5F
MEALVSETPHRRDRLSQGPDLLFCCGTLRFDAVLKGLLERIPHRTPASAPGYRTAALEGRAYPGLVVRAVGGAAPGVVLTDLSNAEWRILDRFEDEQGDLRKGALSRRGFTRRSPNSVTSAASGSTPGKGHQPGPFPKAAGGRVCIRRRNDGCVLIQRQKAGMPARPPLQAERAPRTADR